ncbi:Ras family protein [Xanthomonas populi]|uniref:Ras family protein n=1 Tax=Xanthomonas populi TaxID=53414 RepID=A0A2S7EVA7_9XANT|nr:Ras family protein [Xanthomonas populi]PPU97047.1 Ras family protein [Xanthomonas populi]
MSQSESIEQLGQAVTEIADSMTKVATNVALLGVDGDADEQMRIITEENNKVLNRIRQLYHLPPPPPPPPEN